MEFFEVTAKAFYDRIGPLDVNPYIQPGKYPYTSLWILRDWRTVIGKSVGFIPEGKALEETRYYLCK